MPPPTPAKKLLLIAWDAAEWSLIQPLLDGGALPNLARLIEQGALAKLTTLSPPLAAPLWATVATGVRPEHHGVFADSAHCAEWHAPTLWQLAKLHGRRSIVIGWPGTRGIGPADNPIMVSDTWVRPVGPGDQPWPLPPGTLAPERLQDDLAELRVHPGEFSLADLQAFVPDVATVELSAEPQPIALAHQLAAATSIQCAATYLLENEPWDFAAIHFAAPGAVTRDFLDLAPPRLPQVPEPTFERYHRVIDETLKLHDRMLARLLELAGTGTTVLLCSASGWFTGAQRPSLAPGEHAENVARERPAGWAVLRAAGVKTDDILYGGSLLDLAPNAAWLLGLPVPASWPGREWSHAFAAAPPLHREAPGEPARPADAPWPSGDSDVEREHRYLLARFLLGASRASEAIPLLLNLHAAWPHRAGPALHLIPALAALGRTAEARALLDELTARPEGGLLPREGRRAKFPPQFEIMRGLLALAQNQPEAATVHLEKALAASAQGPEFHTQLGHIYLLLRRGADARAAFARALESDPDSAAAHYGLGLTAYRARDYSAAADHALAAASRQTEPFVYHLLLGLSLARAGERTEAIAALHHALARAPHLLLAHRTLIVLHRRAPAETFQVEAHRRAAREIIHWKHQKLPSG